MINLAVRERPILFSGPMVSAILKGRKTQTRRLMKRNLPSQNEHGDWVWYPAGEKLGFQAKSGLPTFDVPQGWAHDWCPYGGHGQHLWVREAIRCTPEDVFYQADGQSICVAVLGPTQSRWIDNYGPEGQEEVTIPSIHMPRWASRIMLEIVSVKVERVQDISQEDCIAEGVEPDSSLNNYGTGAIERDAFAELWDSLNAKRGYGWDVNPWVWIVEFRQIQAG